MAFSPETFIQVCRIALQGKGKVVYARQRNQPILATCKSCDIDNNSEIRKDPFAESCFPKIFKKMKTNVISHQKLI